MEMTIREFATAVGTDAKPASIRRLLKKYGIPFRKVSGRFLLSASAVTEWKRHREACSMTEWKRRGRNVKSDEAPLRWVTGQVQGRNRTWAVYAEDQTEPIRRIKDVPPTPRDVSIAENVLVAAFRVNRSAKRYRDAASSCYRSRVHGFAGVNRSTKEKLYELKEAAIVHAVRQRWLHPVEQHGSMCVYRGHGFCFHSPLFPEGVEFEHAGDAIFVDSKAKETGGIRLKDAVATLEQLPVSEEGFLRKPVVRHPHRRKAEPGYRDEGCSDDDFATDEFGDDELDWDDDR